MMHVFRGRPASVWHICWSRWPDWSITPQLDQELDSLLKAAPVCKFPPKWDRTSWTRCSGKVCSGRFWSSGCPCLLPGPGRLDFTRDIQPGRRKQPLTPQSTRKGREGIILWSPHFITPTFCIWEEKKNCCSHNILIGTYFWTVCVIHSLLDLGDLLPKPSIYQLLLCPWQLVSFFLCCASSSLLSQWHKAGDAGPSSA